MNGIPVFHLISSLRLGGAERQFITLLRSFDREDFHHEVGVFRESGPLLAEIDRLGLQVHWLNYRHRRILPFHGRLRSILRSRGIQVVHVHLHMAGVHGRIAARTAGVPVAIYTEHSDVSRRGAFWRFVERSLAGWTSVKITVSEAQRQASIRLESFPPDLIRTIPNSIPLSDFLPTRPNRGELRREWCVGEDEIVVGNISNLTHQKRLDRLILASGALHAKGILHHLLLVGDGPLRADLESLAKERLPAGKYRFLGQRNDVPRLLQGMDVFAISSAWEGMPINLLEAMAAGLPIVATRVGGIPDVVSHDKEAFLVGDDVRADLIAGLEALVSDQELRERLGGSARERAAREHDSSRNARRIERIYFDEIAKTGADCTEHFDRWKARWGMQD